eukprot:CAMPEP_0175077176 /NCGR_PEP_ID=MMETSP0052_2-20121109/23220_1 /TAXON_ID=51329 ORGANISM="Polytomella parva, Strain SAG 63-3" /NCGR_SAMPLE_ID=MMETSP0052_2 /ASSEMBLY_ACC=CAM_ASM_000194 /LENGTH=228 /DNA_ID=CAMNT_0016346563 /DNA_START=78 /DNA_END=761 /DNA_ORIENTATION=+
MTTEENKMKNAPGLKREKWIQIRANEMICQAAVEAKALVSLCRQRISGLEKGNSGAVGGETLEKEGSERKSSKRKYENKEEVEKGERGSEERKGENEAAEKEQIEEQIEEQKIKKQKSEMIEQNESEEKNKTASMSNKLEKDDEGGNSIKDGDSSSSSRIQDLITNCMTLLVVVQKGSMGEYKAEVAEAALESAAQKLKPSLPENDSVYEKILQLIQGLQQALPYCCN